MEFSMEWNIICRICLQEGEMHSIFEKDINGLRICDKIMLCSNVKIIKGENLPENICTRCYEELKIAYNFRDKCESSDAALKSFIMGSKFVNEELFTNNTTYNTEDESENERNKDEIIIGDSDKIEEIEVKVEEDEKERSVTNDNGNDEIEVQSCPEEFKEYLIEFETNNFDGDDSCQEFVLLNIKDDNNEEKDTLEFVNVNNIDELSKDVCIPSNSINKGKKERNQKRITNKKIVKTKGKLPKQHICDVCGNIYKHKHSLDTHMRRHRNEKPFACELCGRAFVLNVELKCHMRTHTGQKPYGCRYCDRHFSDFGSRIKHERTHTGERPYVCDTCGKGFAYSYGLSSHILTHTGEKPHSCQKCGRRFTKKHHLKNHLKTHVKHELRMKLKDEALKSVLKVNEANDNIFCDIKEVKYFSENEQLEKVS